MFSKQHLRSILLAATIVLCIILLAPWFNYQDHLAQGDHGRDLYAPQAILRGELPYKNFWWVYGPLMPYAYAVFYMFFGAHVVSMILGKLLFKLIGGIFLYLGLSVFISPLGAFLAAAWYAIFMQDFFFTYNHVAGIAMILTCAWALAHYIKEGKSRWAYGALIPIFLLCLTKINFGLVALLMALGTLLICDRIQAKGFDHKRKLFLILACLVLPLLTYAIYSFCLKGLSLMEIRQCLPYLSDDQPYNTTPWLALQNFIAITWHNMTSSWMHITFAVIIITSLLRCIFLAVQRSLSKETMLFLAFLMIFYTLNFHEYLKSGVFYRGFWAQPFSIMLSFVLIDIATTSYPAFVRKMIFCFIVFMGATSWQTNVAHINAYKIPSQAFSLDGKTIYLSSQPTWIQTVADTTAYLKNNLRSDELFFALPYDCLYYYLTAKKSPTRQLIFFDHIKLTPDQEERVIAELEANKVNYVVLSNRAFARQEYGLGIFGQSYGQAIAAYINKNFAPVARFGDWTNEPGWAWNHGTLILKRK